MEKEKEAGYQPTDELALEPAKGKKEPTNFSDVLLTIQAPHIPCKWVKAEEPLMKQPLSNQP